MHNAKHIRHVAVVSVGLLLSIAQPALAERQRPTQEAEPIPGRPQGQDYQEDLNRQTGLQPVPPVPARIPSEVELQTPETLVPERWRLVDQLGVVKQRWYDPYNHNTIKADKPLFDDWFFSFGLTSETIYEPRRLPTPVADQTTAEVDSIDIFGDGRQHLIAHQTILALILFKGDTTFRPPDYEFRLTPVFNQNYTEAEENRALRIDPQEGRGRSDQHLGWQEIFVDVHLGDVSRRYDFYSVRLGIQPFSTDFRGFLFQDLQLGARLFGNLHNNVFQYNLAWFRKLEKDTNTGLNDLGEPLRKDDIFIANLFWQDFPSLGFISQATVVHNRNRESEQDFFFDTNGFIQRPASLGLEKPRDYDVTYIGLNGDGHFGRLNLTASMYYAIGDQSRSVFVDDEVDINAFFAAAEAGIDFSWTRVRLSGLYASGDDDPLDDVDTGFDAIFENPIFAGFDTNFWTRQAVPLIGGGGVALSTRNGILNNLRSSKEHGQSNFANPGLILLGLGFDFDLTPALRVSTNANKLYFDDTATLSLARNQGPVDRDIGWDLSVAVIWRPLASQNIIVRLSGATLLPGQGYKDLFVDEKPYSVLANVLFVY